MDLRYRQVRFKISDIYMPEPELLLWHLHCNDLLEGKVIEMSDSGRLKEAFAVVEVGGMEQPVIVPVDLIQEATD